MAATDSPRGLVPIKMPVVNGVEYLKVTSGFTGDIGVGTPLVETAAGFVQPVSSATPANQQWVGVAMDPRLGTSGKTEAIAVCTDPNQKFLIQAAGSVTQAGVGASAGFSTPNSVHATDKSKSIAELTGLGTTASAPMRVVGRHERDGNDWGTNVDLIVQPIHGMHQRAGAAGV